MMNITRWPAITRLQQWLFTVHETKHIPRSKFNRIVDKAPLLMAMYVSSILVGISTFATFPMLFDPVLQGHITNGMYDFLRISASVIGGMSFDIIVTSVVFSLRKNLLSYLTILAALFTGLAMALDLYLKTHILWLHSLFILMGVLYALHLATTRGLNVKEIEKRLSDAESTTMELSRTNAELASIRAELEETNRELLQTNQSLEARVENYTEAIIEKLATKTTLTANEVVLVVGGNRSKVLEKVRQYRKEADE